MRRSIATAVTSIRARQARVVQIAKALLGIGLLTALLLWQDNGRELLEVFAQFDSDYIAMLLLISLGLNAISSIKWSLFIHERGIKISQLKLFNLYLIGKFFSNFLPSMVGGDIARIYLLGLVMGSYSRSFASVFLERATGVVGLTLLAAGFAVANPEMSSNAIIPLTIAAAALGSAVAIVVFYHPSLMLGAVRLFGQIPLIGSLTHKIERMVNDVTYFRHRKRLLLLSLAYSFGFHLLAGINVYVACLSIGLAPDLGKILVITPVIMLLAMIPISPNNIGWWEWCFSILLVEAGASMAEGLAVALTLRAATMVMSVLGGLLFLQQRFAHGDAVTPSR